MNRSPTTTPWKQTIISSISIIRRVLGLGAIVSIATIAAFAQDSNVQEKLAAVKQSVAQNAQGLRQYQWIETTQLTLKGDARPPTQNNCRYGPDGQVQKTSMGPPPAQPSGGRLKKKVIENKKEEMQDYMADVKALLSMYVPPDPQKMEQAKQSGKVSLNPAGSAVNFIFRDYAQPSDQMTLVFDTTAKKIASLGVNTYMGKTKDTVSLQVQMATLPDGTSYVQETVFTASAKQLVATTTNSNYRKLGE